MLRFPAAGWSTHLRQNGEGVEPRCRCARRPAARPAPRHGWSGTPRTGRTRASRSHSHQAAQQPGWSRPQGSTADRGEDVTDSATCRCPSDGFPVVSRGLVVAQGLRQRRVCPRVEEGAEEERTPGSPTPCRAPSRPCRPPPPPTTARRSTSPPPRSAAGPRRGRVRPRRFRDACWSRAQCGTGGDSRAGNTTAVPRAIS